MHVPDLSADDRAFMYSVARRIVRCDDAANDVTQEALLRAHRNRHKFRGEASHRTWLYRIAVTTALGLLRKQRRSREELTVDEPAELTDPAPSPEHAVAARQLAERAATVLSTIDDAHRDVLVLRAADCSEGEIASALGITVSNVKIRAHRARHRIRETLALADIDARVALG